MNNRDYHLRKARRTKAEVDWSTYKKLRNRVNRVTGKAKQLQSYNKNLLTENENDPKRFWKAIKSIFPTKGGDRSSTLQAMNLEDGITTDSTKIANGFGFFFSNIATELKMSLNILGNHIWQKVISHDFQAVSTSLHFHFKQVNSGTVLKELRNLKRSKSPGPDDIPPSLLKDAASCLAEPLTYVINMSLRTGQVPNQWKQAKVLPLFKSGNAIELDNYRPISILPVLSKVLERVVHTQFIDYLESNRLLYKYQFVFRRQHSTNLAVTFSTDSVRGAMDNGQFTGSVFIDLRKVFNTVDHSCLLEKLKTIGFHSQEHVWFTDYLFNRHQTIVYKNCKSESFPVFCGVP